MRDSGLHPRKDIRQGGSGVFKNQARRDESKKLWMMVKLSYRDDPGGALISHNRSLEFIPCLKGIAQGVSRLVHQFRPAFLPPSLMIAPH